MAKFNVENENMKLKLKSFINFLQVGLRKLDKERFVETMVYDISQNNKEIEDDLKKAVNIVL